MILRPSARARRYSVTEECLILMRDAQQGRCAICQRLFDGTPCLDHCHVSGKARGLLCDHCNRGLGYFRDRPEVLLKAAEYLGGGRKPRPRAVQPRGRDLFEWGILGQERR